jgi:hypothetical protein
LGAAGCLTTGGFALVSFALSSVELQLDTPNAAISANTASVAITRLGVQNFFVPPAALNDEDILFLLPGANALTD